MKEVFRVGEKMKALVDSTDNYAAVFAAICTGIDYASAKFDVDPIEVAEKISKLVVNVNTKLGRMKYRKV